MMTSILTKEIQDKQVAFEAADKVEKKKTVQSELLAVIAQYLPISPPEISGILARLKAQIEIQLKEK